MATYPLTREELLEQAHYIYVGQITDVREPADGPKLLAEADMDVEEVEKSILGTGEERPTLHYWRASPEDPGDTGQHSPLVAGTRVRAFVAYDAEGRANLLDPNGWEPA